MTLLHLLLRLGITAFLIAMFFIANHFETGMFSTVFRIFATIGLAQIVVSNYLWRTNNLRIQAMIDQGVISDEYDSRTFIQAAIRGGAIALGIFVILYLPFYILIGWVWILSYLCAFIIVERYLKSYMNQRATNKQLRSEAQNMLYKAERTKYHSVGNRK